MRRHQAMLSSKGAGVSDANDFEPYSPAQSAEVPDINDAERTTVHYLPNDVLFMIFKMVPPYERRACIPLVCRRWQQIYQEWIGLMHRRVAFNFSDSNDNDYRVTCGSRHIKPDAIVLGALHTWMRSARPSTIRFDPCREYGCNACVKVLVAALGGALPKSVSLPVRSTGVAAQFGPQNVLRALVKHGADTLESLTLRTDAVYSLTTEALALIADLNRLRKLTIKPGPTQAKIDCLPECWSRLSNLRILNLQCVRRLPNDVQLWSALRNLRELDVSQPHSRVGSGITILPEAMGQLVNLRRLNITRNRISVSDCARGLDQLSRLSVLCAFSCGLGALPSFVGRLSSMHTLDLDDCQLGDNSNWEVLESIRDTLRCLILANNGLTRVPPVVARLTLLETLDIGDRICREIAASTGDNGGEEKRVEDARECGWKALHNHPSLRNLHLNYYSISFSDQPEDIEEDGTDEVACSTASLLTRQLPPAGVMASLASLRNFYLLGQLDGTVEISCEEEVGEALNALGLSPQASATLHYYCHDPTDNLHVIYTRDGTGHMSRYHQAEAKREYESAAHKSVESWEAFGVYPYY